MAGKKKGGDVGGPRTGDGRKGGAKPQGKDLMMQRGDGVINNTPQPKGWTGAGKVLQLFKPKPPKP